MTNTQEYYTKASKMLKQFEHFLQKEEKLLEKNKQLVQQKKLSFEELNTIIDTFGYERNDLEEEYLDIYIPLEETIFSNRYPEEQEQGMGKLNALDALYKKIYADTDTIYASYEELIRTYNR